MGKMKLACILLAICIYVTASPATTSQDKNKEGRFLTQPSAEKCASRPKQFFFKGHNYFYSENVTALKGKHVDWLDARNLCREYCMDLVSMETQDENKMIVSFIKDNSVPYIWTSGRLCDFKGCEGRPDLEPKNINGWFWSANRDPIGAINKVAPGWTYNPWSTTGHKKIPQPDNAEFDVNNTTEPCLAVLNNVYKDGIVWHDIACYHEKPFICEDNDDLLEYEIAKNPNLRF